MDPSTVAFFRERKAEDSENNACFDCGLPSPQWVSLSHGTYHCLTCAGFHRSLGVHISFAKSIAMDAWTDKHKNMMIVGGNGKCRAFFREMDIERLNIKDKYKTKAAAWYRDYLKNLAEGGGTGGPRPSLEEAKQPMELAYGAAPASSSSSHSSFDRYGSTPAGGEFSSSSSSSMGPGSRAATMNGSVEGGPVGLQGGGGEADGGSGNGRGGGSGLWSVVPGFISSAAETAKGVYSSVAEAPLMENVKGAVKTSAGWVGDKGRDVYSSIAQSNAGDVFREAGQTVGRAGSTAMTKLQTLGSNAGRWIDGNFIHHGDQQDNDGFVVVSPHGAAPPPEASRGPRDSSDAVATTWSAAAAPPSSSSAAATAASSSNAMTSAALPAEGSAAAPLSNAQQRGSWGDEDSWDAEEFKKANIAG
eukprot:GHVU01129854.1.p1 GENE.GHVU01129854.1~~GHVU01129854.1.p1  ORF type:complete len:417 (-),score=102.74 GHVU01129854.1:222-1472(-)